MTDLYDIINNAKTEFELALEELPKVRGDKLDLDPRAGSVWVDVDNGYIIAGTSKRSLDYYGGFEYVDVDNVIEFGRWKIYQGYDERVSDALAAYERNKD
jgi:hypothetical protein